MHKLIFAIFCIAVCADVIGGQRFTGVNPECPVGGDLSSRVECGSPGIGVTECIANSSCCFDLSYPANVKWCYIKPSVADSEGSVGSAGRQNNNNFAFQGQLTYRPTTANIQFSGNCLFQCTSIARGARVSCTEGSSTTTERVCLAQGCCFDRSDNIPERQCYFPAATLAGSACPSDRCLVPSGSMRICAGFDVGQDHCESLGCCSYEVQGERYCYRSEEPPRVIGQETPTNPPTPPPTTTTTTTEATTTTEKPLSFIELLRQRNGGSLSGFSVVDILTKSISELTKQRNRTLISTTRRPTTTRSTTPATTTTTTTIATTTRITTPTTTPPPPVTRRVCSWGRCRFVPVPTQPAQTCYPAECGQPRFYPGSTITPPPDTLKKIVGGTRAHPWSHPWTAMILKTEGKRTFLCGAAIICEHWLVTAAHCMNRQSEAREIPDLDAIFYKIYVGRHVGWKRQHGSQVQLFDGRQDIDFMEQHENFIPGRNRGVISYDIGLIRLRRRIEFNQYVQPVCMPTERVEVDKVVWASGWGISKNRGPDDSALKQVAIRVLNETVCEEEVPRFTESNPVGILCAGGERNHDTCTGDSGGPLVGPKIIGYDRQRRQIQRWQLYGLTSLGSPSCNTLLFDRQPALYTDVAYYAPWINSRTQNCCRVF